MFAQLQADPATLQDPLAWAAVGISLRMMHTNRVTQPQVNSATNQSVQSATESSAANILGPRRVSSGPSGESQLLAMRARTAELAYRATLAALALRDSALRAPFRM